MIRYESNAQELGQFPDAPILFIWNPCLDDPGWVIIVSLSFHSQLCIFNPKIGRVRIFYYHSEKSTDILIWAFFGASLCDESLSDNHWFTNPCGPLAWMVHQDTAWLHHTVILNIVWFSTQKHFTKRADSQPPLTYQIRCYRRILRNVSFLSPFLN